MATTDDAKLQERPWHEEVASNPTSPGPSEPPTPGPAPLPEPAVPEPVPEEPSAADAQAAEELAAAVDAKLKVEKAEAGAALSQALASSLLADIDASTLKVQQADPNSPLYSARSWQELAAMPNLVSIPEPVLQAIRDQDWEKPSKVQESALPMLLKNPPQNMIFQSQAGTGKTGAFSIVMLSRLQPQLAAPQAMYTCPTFNLCVQTARVVEGMARHMPNVRTSKLYSGSPDLPGRGAPLQAQLIFGTAGLLKNYTRKGRSPFDWSKIKVFVMDEADELVDNPTFKSDVQKIRNALPRDCQIILVSATFETHVMDFATDFVPKPVNKITLPRQEVAVDNVKQMFIQCDGDAGKFQALLTIYDNVTLGQTLIFAEQRNTAEALTGRLKQDGHAAVFLHGRMEKAEQDRVLNRFREGKDKVLVATNVLARGIDVKQISMVVNYDLPVCEGRIDDAQAKPDPETYLHRIGRTGRFGKKGSAIALIDRQRPFEMQRLQAIGAHWEHPIQEISVADGESLEETIVAT